jgi:hypothetical protein
LEVLLAIILFTVMLSKADVSLPELANKKALINGQKV